MNLRDYLFKLPPSERDDFARGAATSVKYLTKLAYNFHKGVRPSAELATQIEIASNQMVRRWESIPEAWHRIWPELVGVEGAPQLPNAANTTPFNEERRA